MSKMQHLHTIKVKRSLGERIIQVIIYLVLIAICLLIVLPCLNVVALAFKLYDYLYHAFWRRYRAYLHPVQKAWPAE